MSVHAHGLAVLVLSGSMTGLLLAQAPTPAAQGQPPAPQQGQAPGGRGAAPAGPRPDGYTQYTRPLAPEDVVLRGKALYETNCASCHAVDLRGTVDGKNPNLLRSGVALRDQQGRARHRPASPSTRLASR